MITFEDSTDIFTADPPQVAILTLACLEDHGNQLPAACDEIIMAEISRRVAGQIPYTSFLTPVWPYGMAPEHKDLSGAISLRFETLWWVVRDMAQSLYDHGIRQIAVINNHGSCGLPSALPYGNSIVKTAVRQLNYEVAGITAIWVQPFRAARNGLENLFGGAVEIETVEKAILDYLAPDHMGTSSAGIAKGELALEAISLATSAYIQDAFQQLARVKP